MKLNNVTLQVSRGKDIEANYDTAIVRLNLINHLPGQPVMVRYYTEDDNLYNIGTIIAIGINSGVGRDNYRIISNGDIISVSAVYNSTVPDYAELENEEVVICFNENNIPCYSIKQKGGNDYNRTFKRIEKDLTVYSGKDGFFWYISVENKTIRRSDDTMSLDEIKDYVLKEIKGITFEDLSFNKIHTFTPKKVSDPGYTKILSIPSGSTILLLVERSEYTSRKSTLISFTSLGDGYSTKLSGFYEIKYDKWNTYGLFIKAKTSDAGIVPTYKFTVISSTCDSSKISWVDPVSEDDEVIMIPENYMKKLYEIPTLSGSIQEELNNSVRVTADKTGSFLFNGSLYKNVIISTKNNKSISANTTKTLKDSIYRFSVDNSITKFTLIDEKNNPLLTIDETIRSGSIINITKSEDSFYYDISLGSMTSDNNSISVGISESDTSKISLSINENSVYDYPIIIKNSEDKVVKYTNNLGEENFPWIKLFNFNNTSFLEDIEKSITFELKNNSSYVEGLIIYYPYSVNSTIYIKGDYEFKEFIETYIEFGTDSNETLWFRYKYPNKFEEINIKVISATNNDIWNFATTPYNQISNPIPEYEIYKDISGTEFIKLTQSFDVTSEIKQDSKELITSGGVFDTISPIKTQVENNTEEIKTIIAGGSSNIDSIKVSNVSYKPEDKEVDLGYLVNYENLILHNTDKRLYYSNSTGYYTNDSTILNFEELNFGNSDDILLSSPCNKLKIVLADDDKWFRVMMVPNSRKQEKLEARKTSKYRVFITTQEYSIYPKSGITGYIYVDTSGNITVSNGVLASYLKLINIKNISFDKEFGNQICGPNKSAYDEEYYNYCLCIRGKKVKEEKKQTIEHSVLDYSLGEYYDRISNSPIKVYIWNDDFNETSEYIWSDDDVYRNFYDNSGNETGDQSYYYKTRIVLDDEFDSENIENISLLDTPIIYSENNYIKPETYTFISGEDAVINLDVDSIGSYGYNNVFNCNNIILNTDSDTLTFVVTAYSNFENLGSYKEFDIENLNGLFPPKMFNIIMNTSTVNKIVFKVQDYEENLIYWDYIENIEATHYGLNGETVINVLFDILYNFRIKGKDESYYRDKDQKLVNGLLISYGHNTLSAFNTDLIKTESIDNKIESINVNNPSSTKYTSELAVYNFVKDSTSKYYTKSNSKGDSDHIYQSAIIVLTSDLPAKIDVYSNDKDSTNYQVSETLYINEVFGNYYIKSTNTNSEYSLFKFSDKILHICIKTINALSGITRVHKFSGTGIYDSYDFDLFHKKDEVILPEYVGTNHKIDINSENTIYFIDGETTSEGAQGIYFESVSLDTVDNIVISYLGDDVAKHPLSILIKEMPKEDKIFSLINNTSKTIKNFVISDFGTTLYNSGAIYPYTTSLFGYILSEDKFYNITSYKTELYCDDDSIEVINNNGSSIIRVNPDILPSSITVDSAISSTSTNPVQNKVIYEALQNVSPTITIDNSLSSTSTNPVQNKVIYEALQNVSPTITIDSNLSSTSTNPVQNKVITTALSEKEITANKVTTLDTSSIHYPSCSAVNTALNNIADSSLSSTSTKPVQNKVINEALKNYVDLTSKQTINGEKNIYGSINLYVADSTGGYGLNGVLSGEGVSKSIDAAGGSSAYIPNSGTIYKYIKGNCEYTTNKQTDGELEYSSTKYPSSKVVYDALSEKSNTGHKHVVSDITDLNLSSKENTSNKTTTLNSSTTNYPSCSAVKDYVDSCITDITITIE